MKHMHCRLATTILCALAHVRRANIASAPGPGTSLIKTLTVLCGECLRGRSTTLTLFRNPV